MNIRKKRVPIQGTTNTANAATTTTMTTMTNFKKTQNNFYTQAVNKNSRSCILIQNQSSKSKSNGRDWYGQTSHGYSRNAYKNAYANTVINENKNMHNNDQLLAL